MAATEQDFINAQARYEDYFSKLPPLPYGLAIEFIIAAIDKAIANDTPLNAESNYAENMQNGILL